MEGNTKTDSGFSEQEKKLLTIAAAIALALILKGIFKDLSKYISDFFTSDAEKAAAAAADEERKIIEDLEEKTLKSDNLTITEEQAINKAKAVKNGTALFGAWLTSDGKTISDAMKEAQTNEDVDLINAKYYALQGYTLYETLADELRPADKKAIRDDWKSKGITRTF